MSYLLAENLFVTRGGKTILSDVSLEAGSGDFLVVVGPNGAGKSTLLSALGGIVPPQKGAVSLDGKLLKEIPLQTLARRRAYLPQNPVCEWPLPVENLVALGLTPHLPVYGRLPDALASAVEQALTAFDLTRHRAQPVATLSGGEFSRAMLARALVGNPDILIVDEPITGLDPAHAMETMRRLADYAKGSEEGTGRLVIASLHDLTLAARYASRILALKDGKVAGQGALTPELITAVFDVRADMRGEGAHVSVILSPKA